ncbi:MAG: hypothetical protein JO019_03390 [Candidatus Kaiserbacteria bacterium]|nr:hypothetical protein [Candidatus Kaiserbacteria bacterium]
MQMKWVAILGLCGMVSSLYFALANLGTIDSGNPPYTLVPILGPYILGGLAYIFATMQMRKESGTRVGAIFSSIIAITLVLDGVLIYGLSGPADPADATFGIVIAYSIGSTLLVAVLAFFEIFRIAGR